GDERVAEGHERPRAEVGRAVERPREHGASVALCSDGEAFLGRGQRAVTEMLVPRVAACLIELDEEGAHSARGRERSAAEIDGTVDDAGEEDVAARIECDSRSERPPDAADRVAVAPDTVAGSRQLGYGELGDARVRERPAPEVDGPTFGRDERDIAYRIDG